MSTVALSWARTTVALLAALLVTLVASAAVACPVCAQRSDGGALGTVALGSLIVMPWIVALGVGLYIRRGLNASQVDSETTDDE